MDDKSIIERFEALLAVKEDNSWAQWSQYTIKAIEGLCQDIDKINKSRESMLVELSEVRGAIVRIEKILVKFETFKEKVIVPLQIKVTVFAIVGGFVGGIIVSSWSVIVRFFLFK